MTSSEDDIQQSASVSIARAFDFDIEEHDAYKRIRDQVLNRIIELLTRNPEKLMAILYRIDVPESAVSTIFDTALPPDVPDQLADLIICPSNLVTHIWRMAMPVRAFENKVYLAVANRTGSEHNAGEDVAFNGQTAIYGYNGSVLADASAEADAVVIAEIHPEQTRDKSFNSINDIFADRREEMY